MPRLAPKPLQLTQEEREQLQQIVSRHKTSQQIALRARIILLADEGRNHREIARELKISREMASLWRNRWLELSVKNTKSAGAISRCRATGRSNELQLRTDASTICPRLLQT